VVKQILAVNFGDAIRAPVLPDDQFNHLISHKGVRYNRTVDQDQRLKRAADGKFEHNEYVFHSMASERQWNHIQAALSANSWLKNVINGRQSGIAVPYQNCWYLKPDDEVKKIDIHLPQALQSYWDVVEESQNVGSTFIEAVFPASVFIQDKCICEQIDSGDYCECGANTFPFLDALIQHSHGNLHEDRPAYQWGQWATEPVNDITITEGNSEHPPVEAKLPTPDASPVDAKYADGDRDATTVAQLIQTTHANDHRYHAVMNYACINNVAVSPLLPAAVVLTIATQTTPTFKIGDEVPDHKVGSMLNTDWKTWTPTEHYQDSLAPYGLPSSGFVAGIGQDNRVTDSECFKLHSDVAMNFDELASNPATDRITALMFNREIVEQGDSDMQMDYGMRHLMFRSSVSQYNLEFYKCYANLDIVGYVTQLLAQPYQSQSPDTILVPCDTDYNLPGVATEVGMHLVANFIREFIQYATPTDKLAVSKSHCDSCQDAPADQLHYHESVMEEQLRAVQVSGGLSCLRFDRRRFLGVINTIITFLNNRLINLSGGMKIRAHFQTSEGSDVFLDQELGRLREYKQLLDSKETRETTNLHTAVERDRYLRLFAPGHWLSSIEIQLGCILLRPTERKAIAVEDL
jgi:hypothetical protein